LKHLQDFCP
jgi:hypothetical protein